MSAIFVIIFLGGWLSPVSFILSGIFIFNVKVILIAILFIIIRAALPRYRYDQLMLLGWQTMLPLVFGFFYFYSGICLLFNIFPYKYNLL